MGHTEGSAIAMTSVQPVTNALRVIRSADRCAELASGAMQRESAIAQSTVGAQKIWLGYVELGPGLISAVHHHGEAESGIYIISGDAKFYAGEQLDHAHEAHAGDFVWVPPHLVHVEMNTSQTEPVRMVVARSTQASLTFNLPTPEGWQPT
ncbi:MAG: cupin domain-containing protein [Chloroflexi bacterium]|nr:MAG: cupin domain-containing protein [Chloroflexota bacterium]